MIIDKSNQNLIDTGEICFHDLHIKSFVFNPKEKEINIIVSDSHSDRFYVNFKDVFDFLYTSRNSDKSGYYDIILGWEEIPNEYTKDYYLENAKNTFISNSGEWNDELFAVRFLMVNMSEFKIICERIFIEKAIAV